MMKMGEILEMNDQSDSFNIHFDFTNIKKYYHVVLNSTNLGGRLVYIPHYNKFQRSLLPVPLQMPALFHHTLLINCDVNYMICGQNFIVVLTGVILMSCFVARNCSLNEV